MVDERKRFCTSGVEGAVFISPHKTETREVSNVCPDLPGIGSRLPVKDNGTENGWMDGIRSLITTLVLFIVYLFLFFLIFSAWKDTLHELYTVILVSL